MVDRRKWPRPTLAEAAIAVFTLVLTGVSIAQWESTRDQLKLTREALENSEAPHVRLWMQGQFVGSAMNEQANIKNAGGITIFNGRVFTAISYAPHPTTEYLSRIWEAQQFRDEVVMGPGDIHTYREASFALQPNEMESIRERGAVVVAGARIDFTDQAKKPHHRYVCTFWYITNGHTGSGECGTPEQS